MQQHFGPLPLVLRHPGPIGAARFARRRLAGPRSHTVQDRPIQALVDDLVLDGHGVPPLRSNALVLADQLRRVAFERTSLLNGNAA